MIVIGATNLPQALDPALTRPGRFDRHVTVPVPDVRGRKAILALYAKKIPLASDVNLDVLARGTPGCTGAELFNLMVNSAALRASSKGMTNVSMKEMEYAKVRLHRDTAADYTAPLTAAANWASLSLCLSPQDKILMGAEARDGAEPRGAAADCVPRGRPHAGGAVHAAQHPAIQGDHPAARPVASRHDSLPA